MNLKFEHCDPHELTPNPWNTNVVSPANENKLRESVTRLGMFKPVIVRTLPNGAKEILGGEHRVDIAKQENVLVPVVNLGAVDDNRAKEISLVDNGRYGTDDTLKLSELLSDLGSEDDLAQFLPYSNEELGAIFSSASIDLDDLDIPDEDEALDVPDSPAPSVIQTHQIMRFKVPIEDAQNVSDLISGLIKTQGFDQDDSMTNAGNALVYLAQTYKNLLSEKSNV